MTAPERYGEPPDLDWFGVPQGGAVQRPPEGSGVPQGGAPVDQAGSGEPVEGSGEPRRGAPVDQGQGSGEPGTDVLVNQAGAPVDQLEPSASRALPAAEPHHGRHEAPGGVPGRPALAVAAVLLVVAAVAAVLGIRVMNSAEQPATTAAAPASTFAPAGPTESLPGPSAYGNLVSNWSFEESLAGWQTVGDADVGTQPPGHTSGSSAFVRARGPEPSRVGLLLPGVVRSAPKGSRYVAAVWIRSTAPGLRVTVRLGGSAGGDSQASGTTLPGISWRRVTVAHTVATAGATLDLEVTAADVPQGEALLIDEVMVRRG
jgi:hypothetical protein